MFSRMKFVFVVLLTVSTFSCQSMAANTQTDNETNKIKTSTDFDAAVALLNSKRPNRFDGLCQLIEYSWTDIFRSGSMFYVVPNQKLVTRGAETVGRFSGNKTAIMACLNAESSSLARQWAIRCIGLPTNKSLVPQLIKVAADDKDSAVRWKALEQLHEIDPKASLQQYLNKHEKDPFVLEKVYKNEVDLNRLLVELLQDPDAAVRNTTLLFIGQDAHRDNINMVPMHSFNGAVFSAVVAKLSVPSADERKNAVYALERLKFYDPDVVREVYLKLAKDPDPDLRWRAAYGLVDQRGRTDVDSTLSQLISDPNPLVRYMTITRLPDAKNYAKEISELANNKEVSDLVKQGVVMTSSAAAANWTKDNKFSQQFLLPNTDVVPLYREDVAPDEKVRKSLASFQFPVLLIEPHLGSDGQTSADCKQSLAINLKAQPGKSLPQKDKCYTSMTVDPANSVTYASNGQELDAIGANGVVRRIAAATDSLFAGQITGIAFDTKRKKLWASGRRIGLYDPSNESWVKLIEKDRLSGTPRDMTFSKLKYYSEPEDVFYAEDITYGRNAMVRLSAETGQMLESGRMPIALSMWEQVAVKGNDLICLSKIDLRSGPQKQIISVIDKRDGTILYQDTFYSTPKP